MFVISLSYTVPTEQVDVHAAAHVAWLNRGIADGMVIAAGRKNPRTGGVILATGDKDAVHTFAHGDPFITSGVATCEIIEVAVSLAAPEFEALKA